MASVNNILRVPVLVLLALLVVLTAIGCAGPEEEPTRTPDSGAASSDVREAPEAPPAESMPVVEPPAAAQGQALRPTVDEAESAVLSMARDMYPNLPIESADAAAIGEDSQGRWWVVALVAAGEGYESTDWYVIRADNGWSHVDHGTGMDRSNYPSDIAWEDVP
jgi:hypothetical protein